VRLRYVWLVIPFLFLATGTEALELDGVIEPHRVIKVGGSGTPGILDSVVVDRGDIVKNGQLLATLQSGVEKATMEIARARAEEEADARIKVDKASLDIARARAEMEGTVKARKADLDFSLRTQARNEQLYKKEYVPLSQLDEAETKRMIAENQLQEAIENKRLAELDNKRSEVQLDQALVNKRLAELEYKRSIEVVKRMNILSPINGVVVERYLSPGEYVETESILKLAQVDPLNVEVIAPVALYPSIKVGMRARIKPEAPLGSEYTAVVKIVDRLIDAASGTFGVRLEMPNPGNHLPAGLKCKVIFPIKIGNPPNR
jgi:multidrug efflux pump subunit AcrA (membrane-fusion protein)